MLQRLEVGGDEPHFAVFAVFLLEGVAQLLVHGVEGLYLDALAVGRVGDDEGAAFGRVLVLEGAVEKHHVLVELGVFEVLLGLLQDGEVDVVAPDFVLEVEGADFAVFLLLDALPFAEVELFPAFEGKAVVAVVLGGDAVGHHGGLDENGAGAAHGVVEVAVAFPSGQLDHAGGEDFVDGSYADSLTVAALVERVAAGVDEQGDVVVADVEVELIVGVLGVDGGALAEVAAEAVHDGILGLEGGIVGVGENFAAGGAVDHEGAIDVENLFPANLIDFVVELLVAVGVELGKGLEDGQRGAAGVVGAVEHAHIALEGDGAVDALDVGGPAFAEFVSQNLFKSHHGFGDHLEFLFV